MQHTKTKKPHGVATQKKQKAKHHKKAAPNVMAKRTITTAMTKKSHTAAAPMTATSALAASTTTAMLRKKKTLHTTAQRFFSASMPPSGAFLELPALSPTMETGGLAKWHFKPGQLMKPGDLIADIETDKAVVGFESQDEYYLAAILLEAGAKDVPVNARMGITVEDEADLAAAQEYAKFLISGGSPAAPATKAPPAAEAAPAQKQQAATTTTTTTTTAAPATRVRKSVSVPPKPPSAAKMELPALSPTMEQGKLAKWHFKEGDLIKPGDIIADIETDKAVVGFESQDNYYLAKILIPEGTGDIKVNALIAVTSEEPEDVEATKQWGEALVNADSALASDAAEDVASQADVTTTTTTTATPASKGQSGKYQHKHFLPATEGMLHELHIDASSIKPTGPLGHLLIGDILAAIEDGTAVYTKDAKAAPAAPKQQEQQQQQQQQQQQAAPPAAKKAAPPAAAAAATPGLSRRRRTARQYNDVQLPPAVSQANKDMANNKVPQHYASAVVTLNNLASFQHQFARDVDLNSVLVGLVAKAVNQNVQSIGKDLVIENDMFVVNKATGNKYLLSRHVATQMGQAFKASQMNAEVEQNSALFNVQLYTNLPAGTVSAYERLAPGSIMNIVIGAPYDNVQQQGDALKVNREVVVAITTDNNVVDELKVSKVLSSIKGYANEPVTMLL